MSAFRFRSFQSLHNLMCSEKVLRKKCTDQEIKNEEVIEGIHDRHFQNFRLARLIWYRAVQVSTRQLEEEWIMLNQHLLTKVNSTSSDVSGSYISQLYYII